MDETERDFYDLFPMPILADQYRNHPEWAPGSRGLNSARNGLPGLHRFIRRAIQRGMVTVSAVERIQP